MLIKGLQKLTLLDYPGKLACTVFLGGCNFRCPFCQNPSLVFNDDEFSISEEEFFEFLIKRKEKLDAVCISGGEPLLNDIWDFISKIKLLGFLVKLDTNGSFPERLEALMDKGLIDYVAMDFKNTFEKIPETVGIKNLNIEPIKKSIEILKNNFKNIKVEFRTTLIKSFHTERDILEISKIIQGSDIYALQKFKRDWDLLGDFSGIKLEEFSDSEYENLLSVAKKNHDNVVLRG